MNRDQAHPIPSRLTLSERIQLALFVPTLLGIILICVLLAPKP